MNSTLIQSFADRDKATQEKNEATLRALEYVNQFTREQIQDTLNAIEAKKYKPIYSKEANAVIWFGVGLSVVCSIVFFSYKIWNWGL
jgi:hypothetical protein